MPVATQEMAALVNAADASASWLSYGLLTNPTVCLTHALILPPSILVAIRIALTRP